MSGSAKLAAEADLPATGPPSYSQLASIPGFIRLVTSMVLARIGLQMVALVLVLLALERFHDPAIAGAATFLSVAPGLVVSPIAGALLDRHGRTRLVIADYTLAAIALATIAVLAARDSLSVPLLLGIVGVSSLTNPLSSTGIRTLFPVLVPERLWERANAIDSNGYVVASIFGPAAAGALVATVGTAGAVAATGAVFALAALATVGLRDPSEAAASGGLFAQAWAGVVYVVRHPTLRALAVVVSTSNLAWGLAFLALPVLVLNRLGQGAELVGALFALVGVAGSISVLAFGRVSSVGREAALMGGSMLTMCAGFVALALVPNPIVLILVMLAVGRGRVRSRGAAGGGCGLYHFPVRSLTAAGPLSDRGRGRARAI